MKTVHVNKKSPRSVSFRKRINPTPIGIRNYRMFNELDPTDRFRSRTETLRPGSQLAMLGELIEVVYKSVKYDGKSKEYVHKFKKPYPLLTISQKKNIIFLRNKSHYRLTGDGIIG